MDNSPEALAYAISEGRDIPALAARLREQLGVEGCMLYLLEGRYPISRDVDPRDASDSIAQALHWLGQADPLIMVGLFERSLSTKASRPFAFQLAWVLSQLDFGGLTDVLMRGLRDRESRVRWACSAGLSRVGDPASLPALHHAARDRSSGVRLHVAEALVRFGDETSCQALEGLLSDPSPGIRALAQQGLERIRGNL